MLLRARNLTLFYSEDGVVPVGFARSVAPDGAFSVYYLTTDPTLIALLFILQAVVAVQLIIGYKTRFATVLSFVLLLSLHHRNPIVLSYADLLFRLLLFWAIFLPLGERWSVDALHRERSPKAQIASVGSILILGQMVFMYVVNGYHKFGVEAWTSGDAAALVLGVDEISYLLAPVLLEFPALLGVGGMAWYYMLLFAWLLFFLRGWPQIAFVTLFMVGHLSFALTVRIGSFPFVAMAGVFLFYGPQFWEGGRGVLSRVGIDPATAIKRTSRLQQMARRLPALRLPEIELTDNAAMATRTLVVVLVVSIAVVSVISGFQAAGIVATDRDVPGTETAHAFGANQPAWDIFAPEPRTTSRYFVFPAKTTEGELVDVYNDRELTFDRPHDRLHRQYDTYRERFYMNGLMVAFADGEMVEHLTNYHCQQYEDDHGTGLTSLNMWAVQEEVTMETLTDPDERDRQLVPITQQSCDGSEPTTLTDGLGS